MNHSGDITSDETWYLVDNPHILTGTVTVSGIATLTIEAGCEVRFNANKYLGATGGNLIVEGTPDNWIFFKANEPFDWLWMVYWISDNSEGSMKYCKFDFDGSHEQTVGILVNSYHSNRTFENLLFYSTSGWGMGMHYGSATEGILNLNHITCDETYIGIQLDCDYDLNIKNSIITNCAYAGLRERNDPVGVLISSYNDVWNNDTNYKDCSAGTGDISEDPLFVGGSPYDYNLQGGSPCLTAGEGGTYMGAFSPLFVLKNLTNDFRMAGALVRADISNDFRLIGALLSDIINDFRMGGTFSLVHIINDFRSRLTSLSDIASKFNMVKEVVKNISNKFNLVLEPARFMADIINRFYLAKAEIYNIINDVRTHKKEIFNINNDFRMIASWQVPGDAGIEALGKSAFTVKVNGVDVTSGADLDSLRWRETLDSSATASCRLAIPYDSPSCPSENQSVEILFNNSRKFYGYIANIEKVSNPEGILVTAEDAYWNLNKSNVDFQVGREISGDPSTYYSTISEALVACGFSAGIGGFIPEVISCVGSKADVISQLVQECGNFGWFIKPNGTKKLWRAGQGNIITLEKQEIGKNLGLYQVIDHNIAEDSSGVVNRLKVIMGEDVLSGYNNEFRFAWINQEYRQYDPEWMEYHRNNKPFEKYQRRHYSSIAWIDRRRDTDQQAHEAYISGGWKITVPPGMIPGYPLTYKGNAWGTSSERDVLAENTRVSYSWRRSTNRGGIYPEGRRERIFYISMGSYPHTITKDLVLSSLNVQYGANYKEWEGHHTATEGITTPTVNRLVLGHWEGGSWEGGKWEGGKWDGGVWIPLTLTPTKWISTKWIPSYWIEGRIGETGSYTWNKTDGFVTSKPFKIPSWNDVAYAMDYANWQLSKTCDLKKRGSIKITMDCADFYALDLSKRIKISGIIDSPINIISIDYDVGSYMVTINVELARAYKRSVNIPIHEREE